MKIRRNYSPSMVSRRCKPPLPLNLRNRKVAALLNVNESVQLNLGYMQDEDLQKSSPRHVLEFLDCEIVSTRSSLTITAIKMSERGAVNKYKRTQQCFESGISELGVREGGFWLRFLFQRGNRLFHRTTRTTPDGLKGIFIDRKVHNKSNTKIRISSTNVNLSDIVTQEYKLF